MTGNNKVWRAPLAGLASVAMLATMGVAASTANAANATVAPYNFTVTFDANGGSGSAKLSSNSTSNGDLADGYLTYNAANNSLAGFTASKTDSVFTGWYTQAKGGEKFNPDTFINADLTLYAHYADRGQTVTVNFVGSPVAQNAKIQDGFDASSYTSNDVKRKTVPGASKIVVSKADNKLASWELPVDKPGDSKVLTGWNTTASSVNVDANVAVSTDALTSNLASTLGSKTDAVDQTLDLAPVTAAATSVKFLPSRSYASTVVDVKHGDAIALPTGEDAYSPSKNLRGTAWAEQSGDNTAVDGQLSASASLNNNYDADGTWHVFATKTQQAFHVTYFTEINGTDVPFAQKIVDSNTAAPTDAPAARQGDFSFSHYSDSVSHGFKHQYASAFTANVTSNKFLAAQWATDKVTVTFDLNYSGNTYTKSYASGEEFNLPTNADVARSGWALAGWYVDLNTGANPFPVRSSAYYTGSQAEFGYYKAGSNGQWSEPSVKKGNVYLTNGGQLLSSFDRYKLDDTARLRINTDGTLQYLNVTANPSTDPSTGETVYKPAWVNIPGTIYAAWVRAENSDVNDQINQIPSVDEAGNTPEYASLFKNWDAYRAEIDAVKAELEKPGLTAAQSADLLLKAQAAQAKLQVKTDQNVYRLYNAANGDHYFTVNQSEYDKRVLAGVQGEGIRFKAVSAATVAKYPFLLNVTTALQSVYNPNTGEHLLVKADEAANLQKHGWDWDNNGETVFFAPNAGGEVPVYRIYNPNTKQAAHLYTGDTSEYARRIKQGWKADNNGNAEFALDAAPQK